MKNFMLSNLTNKAAKVVTGLAITANAIMMNPMVAFASNNSTTGNTTTTGGTGITGIDFGIGKLLSLFFGLVSLAGVFYLGKGLLDFFSALPDRDTGSMKQGALEAIAGLGVASIGAVITFIGIKY